MVMDQTLHYYFSCLCSYGTLQVMLHCTLSRECHVHVFSAGQERFRSLMPTFARGASGVIVMCDVTRHETLSGAKMWKQSWTINSTLVLSNILLVNKAVLDSKMSHITYRYGISLWYYADHVRMISTVVCLFLYSLVRFKPSDFCRTNWGAGFITKSCRLVPDLCERKQKRHRSSRVGVKCGYKEINKLWCNNCLGQHFDNSTELLFSSSYSLHYKLLLNDLLLYLASGLLQLSSPVILFIECILLQRTNYIFADKALTITSCSTVNLDSVVTIHKLLILMLYIVSIQSNLSSFHIPYHDRPSIYCKSLYKQALSLMAGYCWLTSTVTLMFMSSLLRMLR